MKYNLPRETAKILNQFPPSQHSQNLGLLLDKYVPAGVVDKEEAEDKKKDERGNWLREIAQKYQIDAKLASAAYYRWYSYSSALGAIPFKADVDWRIVVGLGGNSILETDLTLHHLYSLPIIPGSALKGLTRTYAAMEDKEMFIAGSDGQLKPSTEIDTDHGDIQRIFGMPDRAGTVIFFDAFPKDGQATFVLDIMNPHYPDYYQKDAAPTNDQNPRPIAFLAVHRTTYMFALALRQGVPEEHKDDLAIAKTWLGKALADYGIGGKTSAGYGYFKIQEEREQASAGQHLSQTTGAPTVKQPSIPKEYVRPPIPNFRVGQDITGSVVPATDDLRRRTTSDTKAFLRYQSFALKDVVIIVSAEEAQNWKPGETRICQFVREEEVEGYTVLICQPRPSKKKKG